MPTNGEKALKKGSRSGDSYGLRITGRKRLVSLRMALQEWSAAVAMGLSAQIVQSQKSVEVARIELRLPA